MKNERILSYKMSQKISDEDLSSISAAGSTSSATMEATYDARGGFDTAIDVNSDF